LLLKHKKNNLDTEPISELKAEKSKEVVNGNEENRMELNSEKQKVVDAEETELLELNNDLINENQPVDLKVKEYPLRVENKDTDPVEKVEENKNENLNIKSEISAELLEENEEFEDHPRLGVSVSVAQARVIPNERVK